VAQPGREAADELLAVGHERLVVGVGAVPLEHGELDAVASAVFAVAEHLAQLEDAVHAPSQQALHLVLGAGDQVARRRGGARALRDAHLDRRQVHLDARAGHHQRGLDLDEPLPAEVAAQAVEDGGATHQVAVQAAAVALQAHQVAVGGGEGLPARRAEAVAGDDLVVQDLEAHEVARGR